jgi:hypothetical protein
LLNIADLFKSGGNWEAAKSLRGATSTKACALRGKCSEMAVRFTKRNSQGKSKIEEVREELAVAREKLVQAISESARENVVMPLRNRVGELLEKVERLYLDERFRR